MEAGATQKTEEAEGEKQPEPTGMNDTVVGTKLE